MGGNAVGKAMEEWNLALMAGQEITLEALCTIAHLTWADDLGKQLDAGRTVHTVYGKPSADDIQGMLTGMVSLLWKENPLKPYAILSAEEVFPQAGNARLDVRVKQADGRQIVFDYKCKFGEFDLGKDGKYLDKEFNKHFTGEQRLTYTTMTQTDCFGIIMVIPKPKLYQRIGKPMVVTRKVPVRTAEQSVWLHNANLVTPYMDHVLTIQSPLLVPGKTFPHANDFGECKYAKACLEYELDEEMMKLDYIRVQRT
jgi:hypothetical protein